MIRSEKYSRRVFLKLLAGGVLLSSACAQKVTNRSKYPLDMATMTRQSDAPVTQAAPEGHLTVMPTTGADRSVAFQAWGQDDIQLSSLNAVYSRLD